jgi:hypothetical protein
MPDLRIQAEVGDQLPGGPEPADVTDRGQERRRAHHIHAGHSQQMPRVAGPQRLLGDQPVDLGDLRVEELDLAHR